MSLISEIEVRAPGGAYKIKIGRNLFPLIAAEIAAADARQWAVVSDSNVAALYSRPFTAELKKLSVRAEMFEFPAGETSKTRQTKSRIEDMMLRSQMGRDCGVVALGGGVAGDLAGFVAATYCRGVPHIQVPTTLVACVDSAVGGKTAVNTPAGKNLIGAFHQPAAVYADTNLLSTLKKSHRSEGLAEVIKYGVIADENLFAFLEKNTSALLGGDESALARIIERSCSIKADVVEKDERETDLRKILNFGHTVGHAAEKLSGYGLSHGEAVAIGMVAEARISNAMGLLAASEAVRIKNLVTAAGLPSEIPPDMENRRLVDAMRADKKTRAGRIEMSLPRRIGEIAVTRGRHCLPVDEEILLSVKR